MQQLDLQSSKRDKQVMQPLDLRRPKLAIYRHLLAAGQKNVNRLDQDGHCEKKWTGR